ncbi:MAG: flagellar biosynthetic protein FliR [Oscillospiraceae bacterium]|nr:flagellar biosynthetic protein FliR [Oscillospiraceae bacterium]
MLNAVFERYDLFLMVMVRMTGFIFFNPLFGRRNVPAMVKAGVALFLSVFAVMYFPGEYAPIDISNILIFMFLMVKEFVIGYLLGLIVNMFFAIVAVGGEVMDMQMGLAMSQMYDPGSNVNMPITGSFYNFALMLLFFITNAHGTLIRILVLSFVIFPVDSLYFSPEIGIYLFRLFGNIMVLCLKFALPVIAAELITETGVGIVMRAVPQINVFVVGLQLKIFAGIGVMIVCAPAAVWFLDGVLYQMGESAFEAVFILAGR